MTAEKAAKGLQRKCGSLRAAVLAALLLTILLAGCAGKDKPVMAFYDGQLDVAIDAFEQKAAKRDKDYVLHSVNLGSAALAAGYYDLADRSFQGAVKVMWSKAGETRGMLSLISSEAIKVFKGEPFEKAMASFYLGIIYYQRGEYDNAAAGFRKALLADKQSDKKHRFDFAIAYYMLARCYVKQSDMGNAEQSLKRAKRAYPSNPYLDLERIKRDNLVLILESGHAPQKYRHGPGASLDSFKEVKTADIGGAATIGAKYVGRGAETIDLFYQAKTRGSTGKDAVQATKGVLRDAAVVTAVAADNTWVQLGAALFAVANQSQADIRQWKTLPQKVSLLSARVPPGKHAFQIDFFNASNAPIAEFRQVWNNVAVHRGRDTLYYFRALPNQGGNIERVRPPKAAQAKNGG